MRVSAPPTMTFKEYVYMSAMRKMNQEKALGYIRELTFHPNLDLAQENISSIFWNWFFEITSEGVVSWNSLVAANDAATLQDMLLDLQNTICDRFRQAAGDLIYMDSPDWNIRVFEIYTTVFSDYISNTIPSLIPIANQFFHPMDLDEGIEE